MTGGVPMTACLDSSFLFDLLAGEPSALAVAAGLEPPIVVSALSFYELLPGETSRKRIEKVEGFARSFAVVPVSYEVCSLGAEIQTRLRGRGEAIPKFDALLAATSILVGAPLVTADEHFRRIPPEFALSILEYRRGSAS